MEQGLGKSTRITSIELAVGTDNAVPGETLSFGAGGVPLPKIIDPVQAFDRLFGSLVLSDDPATRDAALRQQRLGKTLVDFLNADARRLKARLASNEQRKLDQHMAALADLEKQLAPSTTSSPLACPSGQSPTRPSPSAFPKLKRYFGGEPYFDAITDAHIDLIALAFACDITRFATLFLGDLSYEGNPLGLPSDNHGGIAHIYDGSPVGTDGNPIGTTSGTPSTWALLATFNRYAYGKVARMMDKLTDYGVIDSTLIYASSEMGNPALHSTRNVPTVLGGGVNGKLRMGRRLTAPADCPSSNLACKPGDAAFNGTRTTICSFRSRRPSAWRSIASARSQTPPTRTGRWRASPESHPGRTLIETRIERPGTRQYREGRALRGRRMMRDTVRLGGLFLGSTLLAFVLVAPRAAARRRAAPVARPARRS